MRFPPPPTPAPLQPGLRATSVDGLSLEAVAVFPTAAPAYVGPATLTDGGWRCCRTCEAEWVDGAACFIDPAHPGDLGRLGSWCPHGLRRFPGPGAALCPECGGPDASGFTPEFLDALTLAADQALRTADASL